MTTYIQSAKKIFELPICWIKKGDDQYRLHTFSKGNNLPLIEINEENERILNEFGAGYRKVAVSKGFKYEYWDKNVYETEKLTLPTYTFVTDEYKYIGENTLENPTKDTITAALNLELEIKKYLLKDDESVEVYTGDTKDIIKQILNGEASKYIFSMSFEEDEEFEEDEFAEELEQEDNQDDIELIDNNQINKSDEIKEILWELTYKK